MKRANLIISGLVIFWILTAKAGSVIFDFRFDSDSSSFNNAAKVNGSKDAANYFVKSGRVDFKGKLNDEIDYRLRWRFDKDGDVSPKATDGFTKQVDYAFIAHKLRDDIILTIGKFGTEVGGFEGNTSAADIYLQSQFYKLLAANYIYVSGAKITYSLGNYELDVLIFNQSESDTKEQTKSSYSVTFKGHFYDKTFSTLLSYLNDEKQSLQNLELKKATNILTAGVKYNPKLYFISFDYLNFVQKNESLSNENDITNSILVELGYKLDEIIPKIKFEMSENKVENIATLNKKIYEGFAIGVEYQPIKKDNFRYHLMLTQLTTKPETGTPLFEQHFIVGTRISADFLK